MAAVDRAGVVVQRSAKLDKHIFGSAGYTTYALIEHLQKAY